jgi:hypothetical protein
MARTRIWRGGAPELHIPDEATPVGSVPLAPAPATPQVAAASPHAATEPAATDFIRGFQPGAVRELAATRFMPIEELFPDSPESAAHSEARTARPHREQRSAPNTHRWFFARGGRAQQLLAGLIVLLVVALGVKLAWRRLLDPGGIAPQRSAPTAAPEPLATPPAASAPERAPPPPDAARGALPPAGLERAAVDAMIAGDFTRAEKLYARLARSGRGSEAVQEALRIVRGRTTARAADAQP